MNKNYLFNLHIIVDNLFRIYILIFFYFLLIFFNPLTTNPRIFSRTNNVTLIMVKLK